MTYASKMGPDHEFEDVSPEATAESDAGLTAFERGDLVAAERHLRRADRLGGHWGAFRLGFLLEETGRTAEAEEAYRRAVDRDSRSAAVNLGHMLEQRNDRAGAIEAYTAAVRLGDVQSMRRLAALGHTVMHTPDGVTVYPGRRRGAWPSRSLVTPMRRGNSPPRRTSRSCGKRSSGATMARP